MDEHAQPHQKPDSESGGPLGYSPEPESPQVGGPVGGGGSGIGGAGGGGRRMASASKPYREVTIEAIIFGVVVGAIMNAAITYAGLKIGFTIVGSAIAAVLGFGVLRGVLRKGSILETNIGQTIASAVNTPNSGVIFTVPVLLLLGFELDIESLEFWLIAAACVAGAVLGGAFIVPLRKQMLDIERLRFPSATAVGAILKSPGAGPAKSILLLVGVLLSAAIALPAQLPQIQVEQDVAKLDEMVNKGRVSPESAALTRQIDAWINGTAQPPEALERHGKLAYDLVAAKEERRAAAADPALRSTLPALREAITKIEEEIKLAETAAIKDIQRREPNLVVRGLIKGYPLELAKRAYRASADAKLPEGVEPMEYASLRTKKVGWAAAPIFGYADFDWRLKPEPAMAPARAIVLGPDGAPVETGNDGTAVSSSVLAPVAGVDYPPYMTQEDLEAESMGDRVLSVEVDRDRDGRPDLIMTDDSVDVGRWLGLPAEMQLIFAIAPFALGAGYLTGRAGLFVLAGGILAYLVINPVLFQGGLMPETVQAHEAPGWGYGSINRPLGIGLLLGGAMMGIVASLPAIKEAFKSIAMAGRVKHKGGRDELGIGVLIPAVVLAFGLLFVAADFTGGMAINTTDPVTEATLDSTDLTAEHNGYTIAFETEESLGIFTSAIDNSAGTGPEAEEAQMALDTYLGRIDANKSGLLSNVNPHLRAGIIALVGALWIWFAGIIIAQCTGMTDWSPISGMALLTVVLVMLLAGPGGVVGAVMIGAALCVAITCASDMMADLKTGYIVGAKPARQQTVELIATGIGPLISLGVLLVIVAANQAKFGVPIGQGTDTTAPQAQALQAIITGVQGGEMPYALYGFGAALGALLGLGAFSGLGVLVGLSMYLPMIYIATYGIGCLLNMGVAKAKGNKWAEEWGVPVAAGFIVGDALLSLSVNGIVLALG